MAATRRSGPRRSRRQRRCRSCCKPLPAIVDELERRDIPYVVGGVSRLFDTLEATAARELFYFLAGEDGSREPQLRTAWRDANLGLSRDDLDRGLAVAVRDRAAVAAGGERFGVYNLQRSFLSFLTAIELREEKIEGASSSHAHSRSEVVYYTSASSPR